MSYLTVKLLWGEDMKIEKIKPIPKYILKLIRKAEMQRQPQYTGYIRFYSYFAKNDGELIQITVACKNKLESPRWRCKQVVVHGIHSDKCFLKDIVLHYMGNYSVGWFDEGLQKERKWYESPDWGWQEDKYFNIYCPVLNKEYLSKFPEYKYSAVMLYPYNDIFKYLRLYEKYPQAEMLVKFGLEVYATSVQLLKKVGKDKKFRKWLIQKRNELRLGTYYVGTILIAYKTGKAFDRVQKLEAEKKSFYHQEGYKNIKRIFKTDKEVTSFLEYIQEQNTNLHSYSDYLYACEYLGLDMSIPKNRMPHNFKHWHDIRIDEYNTAKALKDEEERKELYAKFASVAEKYLSLQKETDNAFVVVIARSPQELIKEGEELCHCVGRMNYDQRFIREESLIFFVRNIAEPNKPFVTVEYSLKQHKVLQCYGEHDHRPNDNVLNFVNKKWLPYANRQLKKIQLCTTTNVA